MALVFKSLVEKVEPEAAYFHLDEGRRAGTILFDATDPLDMAEINEPLFEKLEAKIDIQPAISLEELLQKI